MAFLAPLFLAALAAVAIPVWVHLTHRERREPVVFPSLMFLQQIPFRTQRHQRIRHWLLFLLRAAAVVLLAAAFARPFVRGAEAGASEAADHLVLLVDRSASMGARGRWVRALAAAREAVAALPATTRVSLVAFDDRAETLAEPTTDRALFAGALARAHPGAAAGRLAPALRLAGAVLERSGGAGTIVLVSDFQRGVWSGDAATDMPGGATLRTVDVGDSVLVNTTLAGLVLEPTAAESRTIVAVRVAATGGAVRSVPVSLALDGREVQTVTVRVSPGGAAIARFDPVRDPDQPRRARITTPADDYPADDSFDFVLGAPARLGVLVLTRGDAPAGETVYLRRAFAVARDPAWPVTVRPAGQLRAADLAAARVVVLHDVPFPGAETGRRLLDWVAAGGGLLVALGARGTAGSALADSIRVDAQARDHGDGAASAAADVAHPLFAAWSGAHGDPFAGVRTWRSRGLGGGGRVLARFDDGTSALTELRWGAGRVVVAATDLANRWSDLPLQPSFVPLMHGAAAYLAGWVPAPPAYVVGDVAEVPRPVGADQLVHEQPDGAREPVADAPLVRLALRERGFHQLRGTAARGATLLAANVPPAESDPARVDPARVAADLGRGAGAAPRAAAAAIAPFERERRQRLWWYVLAAALLVLVAEGVLAHRLRRI